jgi:hypothetical protein
MFLFFFVCVWCCGEQFYSSKENKNKTKCTPLKTAVERKREVKQHKNKKGAEIRKSRDS